ncbi:MAG: sulfate adenylyltransferase subunit CysN [Hyphomicrobiales bacterium]|nr:sulfate adenylyltransferase subunit CysN [Hyphomicrobiales bacterium]
MTVALDIEEARDVTGTRSGAKIEPFSENGRRGLLRFLTCGSVDDGKSTLIGRLLFEQKLVLDDQMSALARDSRKYRPDEEIDYSLLVDGLEAEREQGITIDVAYRYFATPKRSFMVADTPGHEQYTRNMVTGASNAELAVLLVDASKGLTAQTCRHAHVVSLLGIRHVVLAVNKIDLIGFDENVFGQIRAAFDTLAKPLGFKSLTTIPISARHGDNVSVRSERTAWYAGPSLLEFLETVEVDHETPGAAFRMPVQMVSRPHANFRGYCGTIASGRVRRGDEVTVAPSFRSSRIERILRGSEELDEAVNGDAVTVTLSNEIDVSRGDVLGAPRNPPQIGSQFTAHLIWMGEEHLLPGRAYVIKLATRTVGASVTEIKHRIDVETLAHTAARTLEMNEIGLCNIAVSQPVVFDLYAENRTTGAFILIDRMSNATVAAGMILHGLNRSDTVRPQALSVSKQDRIRLKGHSPALIWFTGLSGAGKSTIANALEARLNGMGVHTLLLDGDNVRGRLNKDLGFTDVDRVENIRRVGEVARLMLEGGLIVLCAFISPFAAERRLVREMVQEGEFIEVHVDAPLETCIARDPKGLYRRALAGEIRNFTGIDQVYEPPASPELVLHSASGSAGELAERVVAELRRRRIIGA